MTIIATGIDLAKSVVAVHGVSAGGDVQMRQPKVACGEFSALMATLPPGMVGMKACSGVDHWAGQLQAHGHPVRKTVPYFLCSWLDECLRIIEHHNTAW